MAFQPEAAQADDFAAFDPPGEFVENKFLELYGLQSLAKDHLKQFIRGLRDLSPRHVRLRVFRVVSGAVPKDPRLSLEAAHFYVRALARLLWVMHPLPTQPLTVVCPPLPPPHPPCRCARSTTSSRSSRATTCRG